MKGREIGMKMWRENGVFFFGWTKIFLKHSNDQVSSFGHDGQNLTISIQKCIKLSDQFMTMELLNGQLCYFLLTKMLMIENSSLKFRRLNQSSLKAGIYGFEHLHFVTVKIRDKDYIWLRVTIVSC